MSTLAAALTYLCHLPLRRLCSIDAAAVPLPLLLLGPGAGGGGGTPAATAGCPLAGLLPDTIPPTAVAPGQAGLRHVRPPRAAALTAVRCRLFPRLPFLYTSSRCCPPLTPPLSTVTVLPPLLAGKVLCTAGLLARRLGSVAAAGIVAADVAACVAAAAWAGSNLGLAATAAAVWPVAVWPAAVCACCCCMAAAAPDRVHVLLCRWLCCRGAPKASVTGLAGTAGACNAALAWLGPTSAALVCCAGAGRVHVLLRGCCCRWGTAAGRPAAAAARPAAAGLTGVLAWVCCGWCG